MISSFWSKLLADRAQRPRVPELPLPLGAARGCDVEALASEGEDEAVDVGAVVVRIPEVALATGEKTGAGLADCGARVVPVAADVEDVAVPADRVGATGWATAVGACCRAASGEVVAPGLGRFVSFRRVVAGAGTVVVLSVCEDCRDCDPSVLGRWIKLWR
jgi:hypothetical protein